MTSKRQMRAEVGSGAVSLSLDCHRSLLRPASAGLASTQRLCTPRRFLSTLRGCAKRESTRVPMLLVAYRGAALAPSPRARQASNRDGEDAAASTHAALTARTALGRRARAQINARRSTVASLTALFVLLGSLVVTSAPALAAAPEEPETRPATGITNTSAVLEGVLNPKAIAVVSRFFEYAQGEACTGGSVTPTRGPSRVIAEPEQALVSGLTPGTKYTFCLVVRNEAEEATTGKPVSFTTTAASPIIAEETAMVTGATEATLRASISPGGSPTTFKVEYGTSAPYRSSAEARMPAAEDPVNVQAKLTGLEKSTSYHFRFVATNRFGTTQSAESEFTTSDTGGTGALTLPDNRAYELVSPASNPGEVYVPDSVFLFLHQDVTTQSPFQASRDGNAMIYVGDPPQSGGSGKQGTGSIGNTFLAERSTAGWTASPIEPPMFDMEEEPTEANFAARAYEAFSPDLSVAILKSEAQTLATTTAEPRAPSPCSVLYARTSDARFQPLFKETQTPGNCGRPVFAGENEGTAAAPVPSHLLFQTAAALTPDAVEAAGGTPLGEAEGSGKENLYDSSGGDPRLVNILGGKPDPNATYGGPSRTAEISESPNFSHVISADGTRIFWTDLNTGHIYVRENDRKPESPLGPKGECTVPGDACTVAVSASSAQFWTASADGRYAFYTEGETLWRFDAQEHVRLELAGAGAGVEGLLGASSDGSYVYVVAKGVLADNKNSHGDKATPATCERSKASDSIKEEERIGARPPASGCNLYLLHTGEPSRFIATLAPADNEVPGAGQSRRRVGDWQPTIPDHSSSVTPDGRHLVFMSTRELTGYDNSLLNDLLVKKNQGRLDGNDYEVFTYAADDGRTTCVSCSPTNAPPSPETSTEEDIPRGDGWGGHTFLPEGSVKNSTGGRNWLSEDGSRVFFDSGQPLVPQDTNGVRDVYEWEREGTASCPTATSVSGGCVFLLSGGQSPDYSYFVDADPRGENVFFTSRAQLVAQDRDGRVALYDARVGGGFPEVSLACVASGCQGVPPAPPLFATPASSTFTGVGNFPQSSPARPKTAAQIRAAQLAKALKACRAKRDSRRRHRCEATARRRFGPAHTARKRRPTITASKTRRSN
jgi:hypothetical protein